MYFEKKGKENTAAAVQAAVGRARELGIKHIVAASSRGATAAYLEPFAGEFNVVIVGSVFGTPENRRMDFETRLNLESAGLKVLQTTHVLSGAERGISTKFSGIYPVEIIAHTLRMMGQGTKVCVEISTMALDTGLIPDDTDIVAIGGSGGGADTALVLRPAHANKIFTTWISEVICKPR